MPQHRMHGEPSQRPLLGSSWQSARAHTHTHTHTPTHTHQAKCSRSIRWGLRGSFEKSADTRTNNQQLPGMKSNPLHREQGIISEGVLAAHVGALPHTPPCQSPTSLAPPSFPSLAPRRLSRPSPLTQPCPRRALALTTARAQHELEPGRPSSSRHPLSSLSTRALTLAGLRARAHTHTRLDMPPGDSLSRLSHKRRPLEKGCRVR